MLTSSISNSLSRSLLTQVTAIKNYCWDVHILHPVQHLSFLTCRERKFTLKRDHTYTKAKHCAASKQGARIFSAVRYFIFYPRSIAIDVRTCICHTSGAHLYYMYARKNDRPSISLISISRIVELAAFYLKLQDKNLIRGAKLHCKLGQDRLVQFINCFEKQSSLLFSMCLLRKSRTNPVLDFTTWRTEREKKLFTKLLLGKKKEKRITSKRVRENSG